MKTMKLGEQIKRVSEEQSIIMGKKGWKFCPKSEWKEKIRVLSKNKKSKKSKKSKSKSKF